MAGEKLLLDTNIVIDWFAVDSVVIANLKRAKQIFIPSIVIGELYFGAELSVRKEENFGKIAGLIRDFKIFSVDAKTSKFYGSIKANLKIAGTPIPENDIWIAAIAIQNKLTVYSRD